MTRMAAVILIALLWVPAVAYAQEKERQITIGLIPEMNVFKQRQRFNMLGEYLSKKTGVKVVFTILSKYGNIIDNFTSEKLDGAFFGSFTGALAIQKLNVVPLARPVNLDGTSMYRGYIFVRKESGIKTAKDMRGKKMAFVDKATTAGYIFPLAYLRQNGVTNIDNFFSEYYFSGSHDAAIDAVLTGQMDIGAAKHSVYDRVRKEDPRVDKELVIIAVSPWVPSNGLCVRKDLDASLQKNLKEALISLQSDAAGEKILKEFGAIGFIETSAKDYKPVSDMAKEAGINLSTYNYRNK